jgi:hypothetical protein
MQRYQRVKPQTTLMGHERGRDRQGGTRGEKPAVSQRLLPPPRNLPSNSSGVLLKILAGIFSGLVLSGAALAEDAPAKPKAPDFVPFVVDQQQDQAARAYLNGLKFQDAAPLVAWLNELEARAKGQWEADHAPKPEAKP